MTDFFVTAQHLNPALRLDQARVAVTSDSTARYTIDIGGKLATLEGFPRAPAALRNLLEGLGCTGIVITPIDPATGEFNERAATPRAIYDKETHATYCRMARAAAGDELQAGDSDRMADIERRMTHPDHWTPEQRAAHGRATRWAHLGDHVGDSDVCMQCRNALADFTATGGQLCESCFAGGPFPGTDGPREMTPLESAEADAHAAEQSAAELGGLMEAAEARAGRAEDMAEKTAAELRDARVIAERLARQLRDLITAAGDMPGSAGFGRDNATGARLASAMHAARALLLDPETRKVAGAHRPGPAERPSMMDAGPFADGGADR